MVLSNRRIDNTYEDGSIYTHEDVIKKRHIGPPINYRNKIAFESTLQKKDFKTLNLQRVRRFNSVPSYDKRSLISVEKELERMCDLLNIAKSYRIDAFTLFKKVKKLNLLKGNVINGWVAACIYYIIRKNRIPVTLEQVSDCSSLDTKKIFHLYQRLMHKFPFPLIPPSPQELVPKFTSELNISWIEKYARVIIERFPLKSGRDPKGIAGGVIYAVGKFLKLGIPFKNLLKVAGVSEMTIRQRYKEVKASVDFLKIFPIERIPFIRIFKLYNLLFEKLRRIHDLNIIKNVACDFTSKVGITSINDIIAEVIEGKTYSSRFKLNGIAAGAIYATCKIAGIEITYKKLIEISHVSKSTIRRRYKELTTRYYENKVMPDILNISDMNLIQGIKITV